ncbi:hypothetical protein HG531_000757 [Fusarium graminearum]|nr:hypothetical protein HG531_000757 [Fusarium graminearum]
MSAHDPISSISALIFSTTSGLAVHLSQLMPPTAFSSSAGPIRLMVFHIAVLPLLDLALHEYLKGQLARHEAFLTRYTGRFAEVLFSLDLLTTGLVLVSRGYGVTVEFHGGDTGHVVIQSMAPVVELQTAHERVPHKDPVLHGHRVEGELKVVESGNLLHLGLTARSEDVDSLGDVTLVAVQTGFFDKP